MLEPGKFQANQDDELVTYRLVVRMKREKCMKSPEHGGLEKSSDGWGPVCTALHSLHNTLSCESGKEQDPQPSC